MGSAPAAGSFEGRLGSSARRGAYVGPGVPGVYRVTRSRTVQQSAPRRRTGTVTWIQPPEDTEVLDVLGAASLLRGWAYGPYDDAWADIFAGVPGPGSPFYTMTAPGMVDDMGGGGASVAAMVRALLTWTYPQFVPDVGDWPPGATGVDYEAPAGTPVDDQATIRVDATMHATEADPAPGSDSGLSVRTVDSAHRSDTWLTPTLLGAGTEIMHLERGHPGGFVMGGGFDAFLNDTRTDVSNTVTVDGDDQIAIVAASDGCVVGQPVELNFSTGVRTWWTFTASRVYLPPRYRYTF